MSGTALKSKNLSKASAKSIANADLREHDVPAHLESLKLHESLPFLLRDTHRQFVRLLQEALDQYGIAAGQWYMLRVLWEEEGLTQAELSVRVGIMTPTTVSTLNGLSRRGLVVRRAHAKDKRKHRIFLTAKGRQLEAELMPIARRAHASAVRGISLTQLAEVRDILNAITSNIDRLSPRFLSK